MPLLYDGQNPYRLPSFATGFETPAQRNKRLRAYKNQLEVQNKREEAQENRALFLRLERNAPNVTLRPRGVPEPDPPDHEPRLVDIPDMPPAKPGVRYVLQTLGPPIGNKRYQWVEAPAQAVPGSQDRYNDLLDSAVMDYRSTFGISPAPDSATYKNLERKAHTDWLNEQAHVPEGAIKARELIGDAALLPYGQFNDEQRNTLEDAAIKLLEGKDVPGVIERSRTRTVSQEALTDSKLQLLTDSITTSIAKVYKEDRKVSDSDAKKLADGTVKEYLRTLRSEIRKSSPDPLNNPFSPQEVEEQVYLTLRMQEHLTEILDEWEWPEAGRDSPPPGAFDEAVRRTQEETGPLFGEAVKDNPGFLSSVLSTVSSVFSKKFIPTLDPSQGFKPTFASLNTVHRGGQVFADPVARGALGVTADVIFPPGTRNNEVYRALRGKVAEDVVSEVISPEYVLIAIPTAGAGTAGLSGTSKAARITANLLGTGLEPALARGTMRGLTLVAKSPWLITQVPKRIRETRLFQEGVSNLSRLHAAQEGGGQLFRDENAIRQVVNDLTAGVSSDAAHLPLRVAVEEDMLKNGRSIQDIIDNGVTVPDRGAAIEEQRTLKTLVQEGKATPEQEARLETLQEKLQLGYFRPTGEEGGGFLPFERAAPETTETIIDKVITRLDAGEDIGFSLKKLRNITQDIVREHSPIGRVEDIADLRLSTGEIAEILKVYHSGGTDFMQIIADARAARQGPFRPAAVPELIGQTEDMTAAVTLAFRTERALPGGQQFGAFRNLPDFSERQTLKDEYVNLARTQLDEVDNSVLRSTMEDDIDFVEWSWQIYAGELSETTARDDVVKMLARLTKEHRGTVDSRLRKLSVEQAQTLEREADDIIATSGLKGAKKKSARERLLMGALDHLSGDPRFDAGRRLKILLDATSDQKTRNHAYSGLETLTEKGRTPTADQLDALEQILGPGGLRALLSSRSLGEKATIHLMDTLGIPRALMASFDFSALLRQGGILGAAHPAIWLKDAGRAVRIFFSEKYALEINERLRYGRGTIKWGDETRDLYDVATDVSGVEMTRYGKEVSVTEFEEAIASSFIGRIPGFKQSQRAYTLFLNLLRSDVHDFTVRGWAREAARPGGRQFSGEDLKDIGLFLNNTTGRGKLPGDTKTWNNIAGLLNVGFFSPRLQLSRFQLVGDVARAIPRAGRGVGSRSANQILRDMGLFFGEGFAILGLLEAASRAGAPISVGITPFDINADGSISSNPNFGKIRLGNTRIDFWGGFSQYARYFSEIAARSATGDWEGASKRLLDLTRSKTSPIAGGVWDAITGHDMVGNPVSYKISDIESAFENLFLSRTIPLGIQDVIQAGYASGWKPAELLLAGGGSAVGTGVSSYRDLREERTNRRNEVSQENYGLDYDNPELSSIDRKAINEDASVVSLSEEMKQAGISRGDKFSVYQEDLDKFDNLLESRGIIINAQGQEQKIVNWTQTELDNLLKMGTIDGPAWAEARRENEQKMWAARQTFVAENSPFTEEREVTNPVDKAMDEYFDISPSDYALPNGEMDWDGYEQARDKARSKALDEDTTGNVADYFEAHEETETEKQYRQAREVKYGKFGDRESGLDNVPIYDGNVTQGQVDYLLTEAKKTLAVNGNPMGLSKYLQWLYYSGDPAFQRNDVAIAYWVSRGLREYVLNDEYESTLMANPDVVRFFPSEYDNLNPDNQQAFLDINGLNYLSKAKQEEIASGLTGLTPPGATPDERLQSAYAGQ